MLVLIFRYRFALIGLVLLLALTGCSRPEGDGNVYPRKPVKLVVPFAAGGGSDTFARIVANEIERGSLLPEKLVIINVPGAGGTIGSRRVKHSRPDGYTVLLLHEGMMTAKHAGAANYGPEAFTPIIGTGDVTQVIAVDAASAWTDLKTLMSAVTQDPDSVVFSANLGAPSHFAGLMLEDASPGAQFRYTQTGGGAKRFAALRGGHADVSAFSIAEYLQFRESGLRALALLGEERRSDLAELPTASELGYPVISQNMQFWWAPLGTPPDRVRRLADAIAAAMRSEEVIGRLESMKISPVQVRGEALSQELETRDARLAAVAPRDSIVLPDFALISLLVVIATGVLAGWRARSRRQADGAAARVTDPQSGNALNLLWGVILASLIYVGVLQLGGVGFVLATFVYTLVCGMLLAIAPIRSGRTRMAPALTAVVTISLLMSFAMHHLFTRVLVVDLP